MLDTGALTEHVIAALADLSWLEVGDGIAPTAGGWAKGQPNVDQFVPYAVVAFTGARPRVPNELAMTRQEAAWLATFQLRYHGASRSQVDWTGMECRERVQALLKTFPSEQPDHEIVWVEWQTLGGVTRNDAVDPPIWEARDGFTFHVVKRGT